MKIALISLSFLFAALFSGTSSETISNPATESPANLIDSSKIKELVKNFRVKEVETNQDVKWYYHQSVPKDVYKNWVSCFFRTNQDKATYGLRMRMQCFGESCAIFKKINFVIDGTSYEYKPSRDRIRRCESEVCENDSKKYWEFVEDDVLSMDIPLLKALSKARSAEIEYIGSIYNYKVPVTKEEISAIAQTIELYKAFEGEL